MAAPSYKDDPDAQFSMDGNMLMCHRSDFVDLHDSPAGFGPTEQEAYEDLLENELK